MRKYEKIREALNGLLEDLKQRLSEIREPEVRNWLMAASMRVWSGNQLCAEEYAYVIPVIYGEEYTTAQIKTALSCAAEDARQLRIPQFFMDLVYLDLEDGSSFSRSYADDICRFLADMAMINGDFTLEEAHMLREISDLLQACCDRFEVVPGVVPQYLPKMITPRNPTGYYQQDPEQEEPEEEIKLEGSINWSSVNQKIQSAVKERLQEEWDHQTGANPGVRVEQPSATEREDTLEQVLEELNSLVGLDQVKEDVKSLLNFIKICQLRTKRGLKVPTISYHLVFTGNPGTGKTTVARLIARLYYLMGILPKGQLVETDRSGLVGGYLGQTAIKTQKVIQSALGGVLFIDEAYSLANDEDDSYGKEAIETILKGMEDHRDELVVIVAGYDALMHQFIESNPGLRSRFSKFFHFLDYKGEELLRILQRFCDTNGYILTLESIPMLREKLNRMYLDREEHFGNARTIRNLFEHAIHHQANRLVQDSSITDAELMELTTADIEAALEDL